MKDVGHDMPPREWANIADGLPGWRETRLATKIARPVPQRIRRQRDPRSAQAKLEPGVGVAER